MTINSQAVHLLRELILCAEHASRLRRDINDIERRRKDFEGQYRKLILQRYLAAGKNKKLKTRILDEFCDVFAYHRTGAVMWIKAELSTHRKKRALSPKRRAFARPSNICRYLTGRKTLEIGPRLSTV